MLELEVDLFAFIMEGGFYLLLLFFTLHTVFLAYHWFTFGVNKRTSTIALSVYLMGGCVLLLTLALTLFTL